jgi:hypothetical protein
MQYLNIVRIIHEESGFVNPCKDSFFISSVIKGAKRKLGDQSAPKLPITVSMLHNLFNQVNVSDIQDVTFFSVAVVAFFSFARIGNLIPMGSNPPVHGKHLCWCDVTFQKDYVVLNFRYTKTIQYKERCLQVPLPYIKDSPFSPASYLYTLSRLCGKKCGPVFQYPVHKGFTTVTYRSFLSRLKQWCHRGGLDASSYATHSFRRGGATLALSLDIAKDHIKLQGDWRSDCYQRYLDPSLESRAQVADMLSSAFV